MAALLVYSAKKIMASGLTKLPHPNFLVQDVSRRREILIPSYHQGTRVWTENPWEIHWSNHSCHPLKRIYLSISFCSSCQPLQHKIQTMEQKGGRKKWEKEVTQTPFEWNPTYEKKAHGGGSKNKKEKEGEGRSHPTDARFLPLHKNFWGTKRVYSFRWDLGHRVDEVRKLFTREEIYGRNIYRRNNRRPLPYPPVLMSSEKYKLHSITLIRVFFDILRFFIIRFGVLLRMDMTHSIRFWRGQLLEKRNIFIDPRSVDLNNIFWHLKSWISVRAYAFQKVTECFPTNIYKETKCPLSSPYHDLSMRYERNMERAEKKNMSFHKHDRSELFSSQIF